MIDLSITIPEGFIMEEVRCEYTISKKMKEIWAVQLDLASQLLKICKKYNIQIFADGGTLLGTVRHKGYIPWDDDMDFCMFRSEYNKLCEIASFEFRSPYFFQTAYTDPGCLRGHAQLRHSETTGILYNEVGMADFNQGIFIDIFPLDEVIDNTVLFGKQKREATFSIRIAKIIDKYVFHKYKKECIKYVCAKILNIFGSRESWYKNFECITSKYNSKSNRHVSILTLHFTKKKWLRKRELYDGVVYLPFEWLDLPVPEGYEELLTELYGNWRKFERGTSMHGSVFFDTENSYRKYISGEMNIPNNFVG